jgi:ATP diphosphatase
LRRHPHVFGGGEQASGDAPLGERAITPLGAQETVQRWEEIKRAERAARRGGDRSVLAGVPQGLGAVQRAQRLGAKAMGTGFRWPDGRGALRKLREELAELEAALAAAGAGDAAAVPPPGAGRERVGQELGDVLLAVAQLANYLQFDAEAAGRAAARRFERRFRALEEEFGGDLAGRPLAELMAGWARAKRRTAAEAGGEGPAD